MSRTRYRLKRITSYLKRPGTLINYLGAGVANKLKLAWTPFHPPRIDIEPNNTCNLLCQHCQVPHWSKTPVYLSSEKLIKIFDQLPYLINVKLQGMGEPLLNRQLVDMLQEGENRGIVMEFFSNGTILSDDQVNRLLKLKHTTIYFSIDGATSEVFESIRVGSSFPQVVENIRSFLERRGKNVVPKVTFATVATRTNLHELPKIIHLAKELGADSINLQTSLTSWGKEQVEEYARAIRLDLTSIEIASKLSEVERIASDEGVLLNVFSADAYSIKNKCPWPWMRAFIAANGDVVPCCILADANTVSLGNVFTEHFGKIWNSAAYRELRRRIKQHDLPDYCKGCYRD